MRTTIIAIFAVSTLVLSGCQTFSLSADPLLQTSGEKQTSWDSGVSVEGEGSNVNLIMPGNINFATGKHQLDPDSQVVLDSVALVMTEYEETIVVVAGHTDSQGSNKFNQKLSELRAASVSGYLISKQVADTRIESIGYGETNPIEDNTTDAGRSQNRRVELSLLPIPIAESN
jgi:outer membrane protein OmpA-like peptidoglycan-associated protein